MTAKPLIGICSGETFIREPGVPGVRTTVSWKYYQSLQRAGAHVVLLPPNPDAADREWPFSILQGLVFAGGEDFDPRYQNDDPSPHLGNVNPIRDEFEVAMARLAWQRRFPTLGICRGCQLMVIANGGKVHQDVVTLGGIQHTQKSPRWSTSHRVTIDPQSRLAEWVGVNEFYTNSFHHQVVAQPSPGVAIRGHAPDGHCELIEAEDPERIWVGVQWHPEETSATDETSRRLFAGFVAACRGARP